ncbi:AlpA family phage regulatory protein [Pseudoxanthomonas sp. JBR18]|uniref:helix-turn-helix transcriptional regulator n=1 Tax=Pseudoxanthomonas sp. JBR18 TaxID=2969308 RepID=UPI0023055514|nr:AlpA family phage regulatory protein [Pseudoxanthomonas sp. JBR18]WCE03175.1 AlpA family phage regulatory protein [Pseudoxanthomonas sp. JBR18]
MSDLSLLPVTQVAHRVGLSRATIYRQVAAKTFPAPIKVGDRSLWVSREIDAWIERAISEFRKAVKLGSMGTTAGANDIIEQLQTEGLWLFDMGYPEAGKVMLDALDEIERLRNEVAALKRRR